MVISSDNLEREKQNMGCVLNIFEHRCDSKDRVKCEKYCGKSMCKDCYNAHIKECRLNYRILKGSYDIECPHCQERTERCLYCDDAQHCRSCSPNQFKICQLESGVLSCYNCKEKIRNSVYNLNCSCVSVLYNFCSKCADEHCCISRAGDFLI